MARLQISCFVICAAVQGTAFARWRKWSAEEKQLGWRLYGWFTALSCIGSVAGALAYGARIGNIYGIYATRVVEPADSNPPPQQLNQMSREMMRSASAYHALFPLELGLVTTAHVFVLHRMHRFSTIRSPHKLAWLKCSRLLLAASITCNSIGFFSNIAAAAYFSQTADFFGDAAKEYAFSRFLHF
jgi:hypothetical protein